MYGQSDPAIMISWLLASVLHVVCHASVEQSNFTLRVLQSLLRAADASKKTPKRPSSDIPRDIHTVLNHLNIHPVTKTFVVCKKCFEIYPLECDGRFPDRCTARPAPAEDPCDTDLRLMRKIKGRPTWFPARRFIYQDFQHWLGRLLCRPGMEEVMDRQLVDTLDDPLKSCIDIFDSDAVRSLIGPDGLPFIRSDADEGRYVFAIFVDGFQAHGRGGPPGMSLTGIWLTCLNLPLDMRINGDNLFLAGIVPGHPSLEQINPIVRPVVDDLVHSWERGTHYSSTPRYPVGRRVRCALVPLIADLLAARQLAGLSWFNSDLFCAYCKLRLRERENLDWHTWIPRSNEDHRAAAERWLAAQTIAERERIYHSEGARWSELLRLPYWNPIKYTGAEPMHSVLENMFGWHVERVWGINGNYKDDLNGITHNPKKKPPSEDAMQAAYVVLKTGSNSDINGLDKDVLVELCRREQKRFSGSKPRLVERLKELVSLVLICLGLHLG